MLGRFAYSLDHVTFKGNFETRAEALAAAKRELETRDAPIEAIFVGRRVAIDPQASGHADGVIASMRRRMSDLTDDSQYLRRVNDQQHADLDAALERTILDWLARHEFLPSTDRVENISEHPIPMAATMVRSTDDDEVDILGPEQ
jgi:hypothetical protein